jgi:hypothetical protein
MGKVEADRTPELVNEFWQWSLALLSGEATALLGWFTTGDRALVREPMEAAIVKLSKCASCSDLPVCVRPSPGAHVLMRVFIF